MPTMVPTDLLNFSVQVLMILVLVMSLRRLYFTWSGLIEWLAYLEARTEAFPLSWLDPRTWVYKALSCRTCFTYWATLACTLFIVFVVPHLPLWMMWTIAIPAIAWSVNHIFDVTTTYRAVQGKPPQRSAPSVPTSL